MEFLSSHIKCNFLRPVTVNQLHLLEKTDGFLKQNSRLQCIIILHDLLEKLSNCGTLMLLCNAFARATVFTFILNFFMLQNVIKLHKKSRGRLFWTQIPDCDGIICSLWSSRDKSSKWGCTSWRFFWFYCAWFWW